MFQPPRPPKSAGIKPPLLYFACYATSHYAQNPTIIIYMLTPACCAFVNAEKVYSLLSCEHYGSRPRFLALVLAGCCQLVVVLNLMCFVAPIYTRNGQVGEHVQRKKTNLAPSRARGSTWPFSQRKLLSCTYRGFPAALLSRRRRNPQNTSSPGVHETSTHVYTHAYIRIQRANIHPLCASPKS